MDLHAPSILNTGEVCTQLSTYKFHRFCTLCEENKHEYRTLLTIECIGWLHRR